MNSSSNNKFNKGQKVVYNEDIWSVDFVTHIIDDGTPVAPMYSLVKNNLSCKNGCERVFSVNEQQISEYLIEEKV